MADLLSNYGFGIGLQGKPKDYEGLYASGIRQRQATAAKQQHDDDAAYDKFSNKIKVDGVHRLYQDESEKDFSSTLDKAFQVWNDPARKYDRKNSMAKIAGEFVERQKGRQAASKKLDEFEKQYQEAASSGRTTPVQDQLYAKVKNGSWDDIENITRDGDEVGSVRFEPSTKGLAVNFRPKIDTNAAEEKILKDPSLQTAQQEMIKGITMKGGRQRYTMSYIPRTEKEAQEISEATGIPSVSSLESVNAKLMGTEGYAQAKVYDQMHTMADSRDIAKLPLEYRQDSMNQLNYGSYRDYQKPFKELNPSEKAKVVARNNYEDLLKVSGAKIKERDDNPNKPTEGEKAVAASAHSRQENVEFNVGDSKWHSDVSYAYNAKKPVNVTNYEGTIDMETKTPLKGAPASFQFIPASIEHLGKIGDRGKEGLDKSNLYVVGQQVNYDQKSFEDLKDKLWLKRVQEQYGRDATLSDTKNKENIKKLEPDDNAVLSELGTKATKHSIAIPFEEIKGTLGNTGAIEKDFDNYAKDAGKKNADPSAKPSGGKNFATLPLAKKQELQKQSGAKTKEEFSKWLKTNGYTF